MTQIYGNIELCGCMRCFDERASKLSPATIYEKFPGPHAPGWRYACEICGNKRCPHHENHSFACTNSNESGQIGYMIR